MDIVIVGGSYAGITAALSARKKFPQGVITLLEKKQELGFTPGALNLVLNQQLAKLADGFFMTVAQLEAAGIKLKLGAEVVGLDTTLQEVCYRTGTTSQTLTYDKLILATGSKQDSSIIKGIETKRLVKFKSLAKGEASLALIKASQTFAVVGAGQVGIEMADSLVKQGKQVQVIESMGSILGRYFDSEMVAPLLTRMKERGVSFSLNESVREIVETAEGLVLKTQRADFSAEAAVFGVNVKPNLAYLKDELVLHSDQSLVVDDYLQTSAPNVFGIGDCIQTKSSLAGESFYVALANNAIRTGQLVVENLIAPRLKFKGSLRTVATKVFDYYIASTGMTEAESIFYDEAIAVHHVSQKLGMFQETNIVHGKLIYNRQTGKVLGAQLLSEGNILEKINTLALGIQTGVTVSDLAQKDYFFHPAWSAYLELTNQLGFVKEPRDED